MQGRDNWPIDKESGEKGMGEKKVGTCGIRHLLVWQTKSNDPENSSHENESFGIRRTQDTRKVSSGKRRKMSEDREIRGKAPTARSYTSLGHRPRKTDGFIPARAESPLYAVVLPLFIVRAFSPCEKKGRLSWGDASLAPDWYKPAPLALNCDFWDD